MDFGAVLEFMKKHPFINNYCVSSEDTPKYYKFRRRGWDGKHQYIFLTQGRKVPIDKWLGVLPPFNDGRFVIIHSHVDMINEQGELITGWMATQTDMLAEDWELVDKW